MEDDTTLATFSRQIFTALISILLASIIIFLFSSFAHRLDWTWPDNGKYEFWSFSISYGGITVAYIIYVVSREQFNKALNTEEVFITALYQFAIFGVCFALILQGFFTFLLTGNLWFTSTVILYSSLFFVVLALTIALVFSLSVFIVGFDKDKHLARISNEAALNACKAGKLPYRQKIYFLGRSTISFLFILLLIILILAIPEVKFIFKIIILAVSALLFWGNIFFPIKMMVDHRLFKIKGVVSKKSVKHEYVYYHSLTKYEVYCNGRTFHTDFFLWNALKEDAQYEFWYIPSLLLDREKIIAYAQLENNVTSNFIVNPSIDSILDDESNNSKAIKAIRFFGILLGMFLSIILFRKKKFNK